MGLQRKIYPKDFNPSAWQPCALLAMQGLLTIRLGKAKSLDHVAAVQDLGHWVGKDAEGPPPAHHKEGPCGFGLRAGAQLSMDDWEKPER